MTTRIYSWITLLCIIFTLGLTACYSDDEITKEPVSYELLSKGREFLQGEIVLNTHATLNGVSKTLLPTGCPTKFKFEWNETDPNLFNISLLDFTVGNMGMVINFKCNVQVMQLNSWEKDEYKGAGWFKFYGTDGSTWGTNEGKPSNAKGSSVTGYYNVDTHEISFIVDYNMMNVRSECFLQTIDKTRIDRFEEEFKQYEIDLEEYKKENGMK